MVTEVAIIGAGPAGLAAACACQDLGLSYILLDRRGLGQSFHEYPHGLRFFSPPDEMEIGGVPLPIAGGDKPTRDQFLAYLRGVVRARDLELSTWESVASCQRLPDGMVELTTRLEPDAGSGRVIRARSLILAMGVWSEPARLGVPGGERGSVFSEFLEPTPFCGHDVLVIGGGNSAVGAALSLKEARANVVLSMRRPPKNYRSGLRPFVKRDLGFAVNEGKIDLRAGTVVSRIEPRSATLQPVRYTGRDDLSEGSMADYDVAGDPFSVPCRFVFSLIGHRPDVTFLKDVIGLERFRPCGRPEVLGESWETHSANVFLVGSLADPSIDIVLKIREQPVAVVRTIAGRLRPCS